MRKLLCAFVFLVASVLVTKTASAQAPFLIDGYNVMYKVPGQPAMAPFCPKVLFYIGGTWLTQSGTVVYGSDISSLDSSYASYQYCHYGTGNWTSSGWNDTWMLMDCTHQSVQAYASVFVSPTYPTGHDFSNYNDLHGPQYAKNDVWNFFSSSACQY